MWVAHCIINVITHSSNIAPISSLSCQIITNGQWVNSENSENGNTVYSPDGNSRGWEGGNLWNFDLFLSISIYYNPLIMVYN